MTRKAGRDQFEVLGEILGEDFYLYGCEVLGDAAPGTPIYTDAGTIRAVQWAIMSLPQYGSDKLLDLGASGVDGVWGPATERAVRRVNDYYRSGGATKESDGPFITKGTLEALRLTPTEPTGKVGESKGILSSFWNAFKKDEPQVVSKVNVVEPGADAVPVVVPTPVPGPGVVPVAVPTQVPGAAAFQGVSPQAAVSAAKPPAWKYVVGGLAAVAVGVGIATASRGGGKVVRR